MQEKPNQVQTLKNLEKLKVKILVT